MTVSGLKLFTGAPVKDDAFDEDAFINSRKQDKKKITTTEVRGSQFNGASLLLATEEGTKVVTPEKGKTYQLGSPGKKTKAADVKNAILGTREEKL